MSDVFPHGRVTGHSRSNCCIIAIKLLFLLLAARAYAQNEYLAHYRPLTSSGKIPQDFLDFYIPSDEYDPSRVQGEDGERFREMNTVMMGRLFASGKVLFNDPLSNYAQKVLDTLLVHEPSLKGKLRVYTLRSAEANAFTSHDGKIFITTGFLANLENEAQLAYVLAHESIHYRNNHLYLDYLERKNAQPGSLGSLRYSREHESEADIEGLRILLRSDYSTKNIDWVLDVLFYSYLPVDNVPLDKSFFETKDFSIPDSCILLSESMGDIGKEDDNYNDLFQTHPSISHRKKEIKDFLSYQKKDTLGRQFLFPEKEFYDMRNIARFELSYLYYIDLKLEESIYNSYILLQDFPGNAYLQKMMAGSLYALYTYRQDSIFFAKVHTPYKKLEGYQAQFSYLFERLPAEQLEKMGQEYTMKVKKDTADESLDMIARSLRYTRERPDTSKTSISPVEDLPQTKKMLIIPEITVNENALKKGSPVTIKKMYEVFGAEAKRAGEEQKHDIISPGPYLLMQDDGAAYNDLIFLNDWISNRLSDAQHHNFIMVQEMNSFAAKYGNRVSLTSVIVGRNSWWKKILGKRYSITYIVTTLDLYSGRLVHTGSGYTDSKTPFVEKKQLESVLFKK